MPHRNAKGRFVKGGGGRKRGRSKSRHSTAMVRHGGGGVVVVREPRAATHHSSRGRRAARATLATSHLWGPVLMAAALGYAKKQGWEIPVIGEIGEDATIAVAGYAALRFNVVPASMRKHVANLTLSAAVLAAHEIGQTGNIPGLGKKGAKASGAGKVAGAGGHGFQGYEVK